MTIPKSRSGPDKYTEDKKSLEKSSYSSQLIHSLTLAIGLSRHRGRQLSLIPSIVALPRSV
jgi:hypothetical protein